MLRKIRLVWVWNVLALVFMLGLGIYVFAVPYLARWEVIRILKSDGLVTPEVELNIASAYRLNMTELVSGPDQAMRVGSVTIDYSPWILFSHRADVVTINGFEISLKIKDGKLDPGSLGPMLDTLTKKPNATTAPSATPQTTPPATIKAKPLPFDELRIQASSIVLDYEGYKTRVPMEGVATFHAGADLNAGGELRFDMLMEPLAIPLRIHCVVDTRTWSATSEISISTGRLPKTGVWTDPPDVKVFATGKRAGESDYMGFVPPIAAQSFARVGVKAQTKDGHSELTVFADACADQLTLDRAGHVVMTPSSGSGKLLTFPPTPISLAAPPPGSGPGELIDIRWLYSNLRVTLDQNLKVTEVHGGASAVYAKIPGLTLDRLMIRPQIGEQAWGLSAGGHAAIAGAEMSADGEIDVPRDLASLLGEGPARIEGRIAIDSIAKQGISKFVTLVAPVGYKPMDGYVEGPSKASVHLAGVLTLRPQPTSSVGESVAKPDPWRVDWGPLPDGSDVASFEVGPVASPWSPIGVVRSRMNLHGLHGSITPTTFECSLPPDDPVFKQHSFGVDADVDLYRSIKNRQSPRRVAVSVASAGGIKLTWPDWSSGSFANLVVSCPDIRLGFNRNVASPIGDQDFAPPSTLVEKHDEAAVVTNVAGVALASVSCNKGRLEAHLQDKGNYILASMLRDQAVIADAKPNTGVPPASMNTASAPGQSWQLNWSRFSIVGNSDFPLVDMDLSKQGGVRGGLVIQTDQPIQLSGNADASIRIPAAQLTMNYRMDALGGFIFDTSLNIDGLIAKMNGIDATLDSLRLSGRTLIGAADGPTPGDLTRLEAEAIGVIVKQKAGTFTLQHVLSPRTTLRLRPDGSWTADTGLSLEGLGVDASGAKIEAARVSLSGHAEADASAVPKYALTLSGSNGMVSYPPNLFLTDCSFDLPITSTSTDNGAAPDGHLSIGNTKLKTIQLGKIDGTLCMHGLRLRSELAGDVYDAAHLATGVDIDFSGRVPVGVVTAKIPEFKLAKPKDIMVDLSKAGIPMGDADITGSLGLDAKVQINGTAIDPMVTLKLNDANYSSRQLNVEATGIHGGLTIDRLSPLSSPGGQELSFKTLRVAKLNLKDIKVAYRIEGMDQIQVEQARIGWGVAGVVTATAFRISTTKDFSFDTNLIFEAVDVGDILDAFAHDQASGTGRLYGRIPFVITPSSPEPVKIGSGFLFMKNGESGTIKITDPETLKSIDKQATDTANQAAAKLASLPKGIQDAAHDRVYNSVKGTADMITSALFVYFEPNDKWTDMTVHMLGEGKVGKLAGQKIEPTVIVNHVDKIVSFGLNAWYHYWSPHPDVPPPPHNALDDLF